jgi:hypothetical protein
MAFLNKFRQTADVVRCPAMLANAQECIASETVHRPPEGVHDRAPKQSTQRNKQKEQNMK